MEDGRPSRTALLVAVLRAHHYLFTTEPRVLNDSLAMPLAGLTSAAQVAGYREAVISTLASSGERAAAESIIQQLLLAVCARSRFVENQLAISRARGMQQLIILGAGLDSTAYRCPELTQGMKIYEVDYPATQAWKRERLAAIGISIPDNLTFVPFDFERHTLPEALRTGGVRMDAMSFFSWLGVQPYLTDEAVMATLDAVALFACGSELVLDLASGDDAQQNAISATLLRARELLVRIGEPFKSRYEAAAFRTQLQRRGFTLIEMNTYRDWYLRHSEEFQNRFAANASPTLLVSARVA